MHWFYVERSQITESQIIIDGTDVNHIKNVLRMGAGQKVVICDGQGKDYYCTLESVETLQVVARIDEMNDTITELPARIYLFQGLPKKDKMDLILQKAVELGVYEVIPVAMKRCIVKIEDKKKEEKKRERWQMIAASAAKQSGRGIIPQVHEIMNFEEAVAFAKTLDFNVIPYEKAEGMKHSDQVIKEACQKSSIGVFIGPEGGFDDGEIELIREKEIEPITLGRRILRTETAGLTILSILMFELEKQNIGSYVGG